MKDEGKVKVKAKEEVVKENKTEIKNNMEVRKGNKKTKR